MHLTKASPNHITLLCLSTSSGKCEIDSEIGVSCLSELGQLQPGMSSGCFLCFLMSDLQTSPDSHQILSISFLRAYISYVHIAELSQQLIIDFCLFNYCFLISVLSDFLLRFLSLFLFIVSRFIIIIVIIIIIILQMEIHDLPLRQLYSFAY